MDVIDKQVSVSVRFQSETDYGHIVYIVTGPMYHCAESKPLQVMAWCRTDTKSLLEPMMNNLNDAHMRHQVSVM